MLSDSVLLNELKKYDITTAFDNYINMLKNLDDSYINQRYTDLLDLKYLLLNKIKKEDVKEDIILVVDEIFVSDLLSIDKKYLKGIIAISSAKNSHGVIIARSLNIPVVVSADEKFINSLKDNDIIYINGKEQKIEINPINIIIEKKNDKIDAFEIAKKLNITLSANLNILENLEKVIKYNFNSIGLVRTEFLWNIESISDIPDPITQYKTYLKISKNVNNFVNFRLFDFGADKVMPFKEFKTDKNPAFSYRGVRLLLKKREILKNQIKALNMAYKESKNIQILLPLVSHKDEIYAIKELIDKNIKIGIMLEVPSIFIYLSQIKDIVNFYSIGTNDLYAYLYAIDRTLDEGNYTKDFINWIDKSLIDIDRKKISVCGDMASNIESVKLFKQIGINKFSISTDKIIDFFNQI